MINLSRQFCDKLSEFLSQLKNVELSGEGRCKGGNFLHGTSSSSWLEEEGLFLFLCTLPCFAMTIDFVKICILRRIWLLLSRSCKDVEFRSGFNLFCNFRASIV